MESAFVRRSTREAQGLLHTRGCGRSACLLDSALEGFPVPFMSVLIATDFNFMYICLEIPTTAQAFVMKEDTRSKLLLGRATA